MGLTVGQLPAPISGKGNHDDRQEQQGQVEARRSCRISARAQPPANQGRRRDDKAAPHVLADERARIAAPSRDTSQGPPTGWRRQRPAAAGNPRKAKEMGYFVFAQGSRTAERSAAQRCESARRADGNARQTAAEVRARFRRAAQAAGAPSRAAQAEQRRLLSGTALRDCGTRRSSNHRSAQLSAKPAHQITPGLPQLLERCSAALGQASAASRPAMAAVGAKTRVE
jgi:hypothetical protein